MNHAEKRLPERRALDLLLQVQRQAVDMAKKKLQGKSPLLPEQYLDDDSRKHKRWVEGYAFWRKEYTARNPEYLNLQKIKAKAKAKFLELSESVTLTEEQVKKCFGANGETYHNKLWAPWRELIVFGNCADPNDLAAECNGELVEFWWDQADIDWPYKILWGPYTVKRYEFLNEEMEDLATLYRKTNRECMAKFPFRGDRTPIDSSFVKVVDDPSFQPPAVLDNNSVLKLRNKKNEFYDDMFVDVRIDCTKDMGVIFDELYSIIAKTRSKGFAWPAESGHVTYTSRVAEYRARPGVKYKENGDKSRAIGLMLFDYVESNDCKPAEAIRWAKEKLSNLVTYSDDASLRNKFQKRYTCTDECVKMSEVLKIDQI